MKEPVTEVKLGDVIYYLFDGVKHYCKVRQITNEITGDPCVWGFWTTHKKDIDRQTTGYGHNKLIFTKHYLYKANTIENWREKLNDVQNRG